MLILSRRATERIYLGDDIVLTIVAVGTDKVRIGVKAPSGVRILRNELENESESTDVVADDSVIVDTLPFPGIDQPQPTNSGEGQRNEEIDTLQDVSDLRSFIRTRHAA